MQLSRRGAATVGSGLYNFMQQRAPSAAPTHACLPLPLSPSTSARSPTPSLSFPPPAAHLPLSRLLPLSAKPVPRVIDIIVIVIVRKRVGSAAASVSHSRYRCGQLLLTTTPTVLRAGEEEEQEEEEVVSVSVSRKRNMHGIGSFVPGFSFPLVFFVRGHGPSHRFSNFPPSFFFLSFPLSLSLSLVSFSIVYVHGYTTRGVLYWIQKPRRLASFFPLDRNYGREILWNGTEIEPNRR